MNCEVCGATEANFHFCAMYGLELREVHMCVRCAENNGLVFGNLENIISKMPVKEHCERTIFGGLPPESQPNDPQYVPTGSRRLSSSDFLKATTENLHPYVAKEDDNSLLRKKRIRSLEKDMKRLIELEKYEECARIRDTIEELKSQDSPIVSDVKKTEKSSAQRTTRAKKKEKKNESDSNGG